MRKSFLIAIRYTAITCVLLGIVYPLAITAIAQLTMPHQANGELIIRKGTLVGSALLGQTFSSERYFHGRPSAAGSGYDAANSGGSNLAQSNVALFARVNGTADGYRRGNPGVPIPVDLVTASASGLDPDISPAAALYQVHVVAAARHLTEDQVRKLVESHIQGRQFGILGEPRVNVLQLNLALDDLSR